MGKYAVVYREKDTDKLIRETGYTYEAAVKRASGVHGAVHCMRGVASFKVA